MSYKTPLTENQAKMMEAYGCIYMSTCNVTNKSYIGQAKLVKYKKDKNKVNKPFSYGARGRWHDHVSSANYSGRRYPIFQAIEEHGQESFHHRILEIVKITELDSKEIQYIQEYETIQNGYNVSEGGNNIHTEKRLAKENVKQLVLSDLTNQEKEDLKNKLQAELDDRFLLRKNFKENVFYSRIRIAPSMCCGPMRADGTRETYIHITVYAYIGNDYKKPFSTAFGGVKDKIETSYADALEFATMIPVEQGFKYEDEVPEKLGGCIKNLTDPNYKRRTRTNKPKKVEENAI